MGTHDVQEEETGMSVTLTINGQQVTATEGSTILEAAQATGIRIPTLCYHPDLSNVGSCRLCLVSVEKAKGLQTACTTPVFEGMMVDTESVAAVENRRFILKMLLTDHPNDCMVCEANGDCDLQNLVYDYGVQWPDHNGERHHFVVNPDPNPFIFIDRNKCILCSRCIRACNEIQGRDVWHFAHRAFETKLVAGADQFLLDARCESCGQCVAYCPTGALTDKMSLGRGRPNQVKKVRSVCPYCGVGCSFDLNVRDGKVVRVTSSRDAPVNGLALCVKGRYGYDFVNHPARLARPLVRAKWLANVEDHLASGRWRMATRTDSHLHPVTGNMQPDPDDFIETDWDSTLNLVADRFAQTKQRYGGDAVAMLASAKCTNEENYLFNKFMRQVLGTNNIDHCARL
jgi:predicted molibdopterin-dependent oxidoreductase YjgC